MKREIKEIREIIKNNISPKISTCEHSIIIDINNIADQILELFQQARQQEREKIMNEYKKVESKIDKPAFAMLYGLKVRTNPYVPKDEIWIGTEREKKIIKLRI